MLSFRRSRRRGSGCRQVLSRIRFLGRFGCIWDEVPSAKQCQRCQKPLGHPSGTFGTPSARVLGELTRRSPSCTTRSERSSSLPLVHVKDTRFINKLLIRSPGPSINLCMMPVMVKKADLNRIDAPEDYEVLDATALGRRLGFKRHTVLAYLSRRNGGRIPRPNRQPTVL
jgi:hypothetical protein